jgi:hypothetical protein
MLSKKNVAAERNTRKAKAEDVEMGLLDWMSERKILCRAYACL